MTSLKEHLANLGRKGGQTRAQRMTKEQRSEAARKAVQARWAKMDKKLAETEAVIAEGTKKLKKLTKQMERNKKKKARG
jgi:hypothetical protein